MTGSSPNIRHTFYWFDYETFGLDPSRDRPAQFGGLRTSSEMEQIGKADLFYCIPAEDYLPDPEACMVTGITPFRCFDEGEPEAVFASKIFSRLSKPGTISIGYNNIAFDDEVTRFMFWRNLIDPYKREWGEGRRRLDLFKIVLALFAFKPEALRWPKKQDGSTSFKLEHLSKVNNLEHSHAHDALSDAFATFYLGRLIRSKEPKFWAYAITNTEKRAVLNVLGNPRPMLYVDPYAGVACHFLKVIYPLKSNPKRVSEWLCWDLSHSPDELYSLTEEDVRRRSYLTQEDRENGVKKIPFVKIRAQTAPFLINVPKTFDVRFSKILGVTHDQVNQRVSTIRNKGTDFIVKIFPILDEVKAQRYDDTGQFLETRLYSEDFLTDEDRGKLDRLRVLRPAELSQIWSEQIFDNMGLIDMIRRYIARNFPEFLTPQDAEIWQQFKGDLLARGMDQARTFTEFFQLVQKLRQDFPLKEEILAELYDYGQGLFNDL